MTNYLKVALYICHCLFIISYMLITTTDFENTKVRGLPPIVTIINQINIIINVVI